MASCTTEHWDGRSAPQVRLTVTSTEGDATAELSWKLEYLAAYPAYTSSARSYTVVIDGETVKSGSYDINQKTGTYTIASGTKTVSKGTAGKTIKFSCSMAFNLTWSGNYGGTKAASGTIAIGKKTSYSVKYDANGGSGAPSAQVKWYGTDLTLSDTKPTRTGYQFQGWATSKDAITAAYAAKAAYKANKSVTLYAVWKALTYTVKFNANGGSGGPTGQTKTYGKDLTITNTKPTRTNYTFLGWGTSKNSTTVSYKSGATYSKNAAITLYAVWTLAYTKPRITNVKAYRCNEDGIASGLGVYARIKFSWASDKTVSSVKIYYKISTDSSWNSYTVPDQSGTSGSADRIIGNGLIAQKNVYNIRIVVTDASGNNTVTKIIPKAEYPFDVPKGGGGISFGKYATEKGFNCAYEAKFDKNVYAQGNKKCFDQSDTIPISCGGTGKTSAATAAKALGYGKVLWSGGRWMEASHTNTLSEKISEQPHGIVLIFSEYKDDTVQEYGWNHFFIPKSWISGHEGYGCAFTMNAGNFGAVCCKYLYVFDGKITGADSNKAYGTNNGITYDNRRYMLRYVMGV